MYKLGGIALIIASILNMTRVAPILAGDGVSSENFPPHSVADMEIVTLTYGWHISHIMGLVSLPLFVLGFAAFFIFAKSKDALVEGLAALISAVFALTFYLVALVIDGLVLPSILRHSAEAVAAGDPTASYAIEMIHNMATPFGGFGAATLLVTSIFIGFTIAHAFGNKPIGAVGVIIGGISLVGFASGVLSLNIVETLHLVGPLSLLNFVFLILVGFLIFRIKPMSEGNKS